MSGIGKLLTAFMGKIMVFNPERNKDILNSSLKMMHEPPYHAPVKYELKKFSIGNVPCECFRKKGSTTENVILLLHGGGYIGALTNIYRNYARLLVEKTGTMVYLVDYRVAPENLYPCALEDAYTVWNDISAKYGAKNIIVLGDSAGGNLSLVLMQKLRDEGRELPRAGVLISPWGDMLASGQSYIDNYPNDIMFGYKDKQFDESLREELLKSDIFYYFREVKDRSDPYVSPVYGDYHGFPECLFTAATNEMLLSDSVTIAEKINAAGGKAEVYSKHAMFHVYPIAGNICKETREANAAITDFINRKFAE